MTTLHIDFETRSALELRDVGLHNYARHPSTDVWCMAWALNDMEPRLIPIAKPDHSTRSADWVTHVRAGGIVVAHNAPFELEIWNEIMVKRHGWPALKPEQTYCTMAMAYAMALPGALEDAALALGLKMLKDMEGRALMLRYARPWKTDSDGTIHWMDECPEFTVGGIKYTGKQGLERLQEYCKQDVRVERELEKRLLPLSQRERAIWLLDYKINQRGVQVDIESASAAIKLAENVKETYNARLASVTSGAVTAITAVAALKDWIRGQGVDVDGLAKQDVIDLLADGQPLPEAVRRALILRQEAGKASNAKFDVMVKRAGIDGRLRQMYQYHGAGPGRWTGRGVQTHNLPRNMPGAAEVEKILALVRKGDHDAIDMIYGPPLTTISRCLRSFFMAPPGSKMVSGDWSNIEGRGQAWFAGEEWKLQAFRDADAGTGPGIYELAYSRMFGVPVESVKDPSEERQVGKVSELAFGYQGGVGSFKTMGRNYNVKVEDAKADEFKRAWRAAHPKIVATWRALQDAAIAAVENPGKVYAAGHPGRQAKYKVSGSFLWCLLPSGRAICYPYPKILEGLYGPQLTYMAQPSPEDKMKGKIIDDKLNTSNWARIGTYGGMLLNHVVQGFSRDFLADGMLVMDAKGEVIVMHTHDDVELEVEDAKAERAREAMRQIMLSPPAWAKGFPLKAKPAIMQRYGK